MLLLLLSSVWLQACTLLPLSLSLLASLVVGKESKLHRGKGKKGTGTGSGSTVVEVLVNKQCVLGKGQAWRRLQEEEEELKMFASRKEHMWK